MCFSLSVCANQNEEGNGRSTSNKQTRLTTTTTKTKREWYGGGCLFASVYDLHFCDCLSFFFIKTALTLGDFNKKKKSRFCSSVHLFIVKIGLVESWFVWVGSTHLWCLEIELSLRAWR